MRRLMRIPFSLAIALGIIVTLPPMILKIGDWIARVLWNGIGGPVTLIVLFVFVVWLIGHLYYRWRDGGRW